MSSAHSHCEVRVKWASAASSRRSVPIGRPPCGGADVGSGGATPLSLASCAERKSASRRKALLSAVRRSMAVEAPVTVTCGVRERASCGGVDAGEHGPTVAERSLPRSAAALARQGTADSAACLWLSWRSGLSIRASACLLVLHACSVTATRFSCEACDASRG
eukprot:3567348-Pleurochrysis_carterae.AAC.7